MLAFQGTQSTRQVLQRLSIRHGSRGNVIRNQTVRAKAATTKDDTAFCVDTAFVLGAAAFQAYLEPKSDQGIVDRSSDGTETLFFDSDHVRKHYAGILQLCGISAANIKNTDGFTGTQTDAYVKVSVGDSAAVTDIARNTLNPSWDTTLNVWVQKAELGGELELAIFDRDFTTSDDRVGGVTVPLSKFTPGSDIELELPLTGKGSNHGSTVKLTATYLAFGENSTAKGEEILEEVDNADTQLTEGAPPTAQAITESLAAMPEVKETDTDLSDAWDTLCSMSDGVLNDKQTVAFIESKDTGTQVWISKDESTKTVVVSFRGTERTEISDILVDINLSQAEIELEDEPDLGWFEKYWNTTRLAILRRAGIAAHAGFYRGWTSVRHRVLRCVDNCTGRNADWRICVTGHSLGGALAVLCAFEFGRRKGPAHEITMYNYGGPRVGNQEFADIYPVKDSWRVHNEDDVVAKIPVAGLQGYRHIGTGVRITADQQDYVFENILGDEISPEEVNNPTPLDFLERGLGSAAELVWKQAEILRSIANGQGIDAHMEPSYIGGLAGILKEKKGGSEVAKKILSLLEQYEAKEAKKKNNKNTPVEA